MANCRTLLACPYCVAGSEYTPRNRQILFPDHAAARATRRAERIARRTSEPGRRGWRANKMGRLAERESARVSGGTVVRGSGRLDGLPNDMVDPAGWRWEVKQRGSGLARWYRALDRAQLVALRDPRSPWLFGLWDDWFQVGGPPALAAWIRHSDPVSGAVGRWRCEAATVPNGVWTVWQWLQAEQADGVMARVGRQRWLRILDRDHALVWIRQLR